MYSPLVRRVVAVLLFVVGVLVGIAGAFTQAIIVWAGTVPLPVGVVLTLLACVSLYVFGGTLLRSAPGAAVPGVGWLLPTALFVVYQPHGSTVISLAADVHGIVALVYVLVGVVAILAASYTPWRLVTERWDRQIIGRRSDTPTNPAQAASGRDGEAAGQTAAQRPGAQRSSAARKPVGKQAKPTGGATRTVGGAAKRRPQRGG